LLHGRNTNEIKSDKKTGEATECFFSSGSEGFFFCLYDPTAELASDAENGSDASGAHAIPGDDGFLTPGLKLWVANTWIELRA